MACPKIALTMLILGSIMTWGTDARAQALHSLPPEALDYRPGPPMTIRADLDEVRAAVANGCR